MASSQPNTGRSCPHCGAAVKVEAKDCWLCSGAIEPSDAPAAPGLAPQTEARRFAAALGIAMVAVIAGAIAFVVTCVSTGVAVLGMYGFPEGEHLPPLWLISFPVGIAAAIYVRRVVLRWARRGSRRGNAAK